MSNRIIVVVVAVIGIFGSLSSCCLSKKIKGSGNMTTSEKTLAAFEKINVSGIAEVRFHASAEHRAVVTVDENLADYVEIVSSNNVLYIRQKDGRISFTKFSVDVYAPVLTGVSTSGSGRFENVEKISAESFEASVSGAGRIHIDIECESFSGSVSGSGRIVPRGKSESANITISGTGRFIGDDFAVNSAYVRVSGSGQAHVNVIDNLNARISGSGRVNYSGEPAKIESNVSGSGRIIRL